MTTNIDAGLAVLLDILERCKADYQRARLDADAAWMLYRLEPSDENGVAAERADARKNAAWRRQNVAYDNYWLVADEQGMNALSPYIQDSVKR